MKKQIIIVAGGKGLRMGGEIPKQFLPVNGKPVLMLTLETFYRFDPQIKIILVLPREQQTYWNELCVKYHFEIPYLLADGGETRFHSVKNGLSMADDDGLIGVHDGVRPFVSQEVIAHCFDAASTKEAAIPVIDVVETVRKIEGEESVTVDRNNYKLVQTPQVFTSSLLKRAYNQEYSPLFTDDASVVEAMGVKVVLVPGNRENIKITTPFDMIIANALVNV
jgi:2-C-methyl-D-erythritol 4-phosphate cytidylyltransferase